VRCVIEQILIDEPTSGPTKHLMCLWGFAPGAEGRLPQQGFAEEVMAAIPLPTSVQGDDEQTQPIKLIQDSGRVGHS
jgi:hypothetical protein